MMIHLQVCHPQYHNQEVLSLAIHTHQAWKVLTTHSFILQQIDRLHH